MLDSLFIAARPPLAETGVYQLPLVLLSYLVASFASFVALTLARRLAQAHTTNDKKFAHFGGAFALGTGIWSMHFIGMLSYKMTMVVDYDPALTVLSMLVAITVAHSVLETVNRKTLSYPRLAISAVMLGSGICAMHYIGMAAMKMDAHLYYLPGIFLLSVLIAISASAAALWIAFTLSHHTGKNRIYLKIAAAFIMGAAICGMHYTGMAAAVFVPFAECRHDPYQNFELLTIAVTLIPLILLVMFVFAVSRRLFLIIGCSILFSLPLVMIIHQATTELNTGIDKAEDEIKGIHRHAQLVDLLITTQEVRDMSYATTKGDTALTQLLEVKKQDVRRKIASLTEEYSKEHDNFFDNAAGHTIQQTILQLMSSDASADPDEKFKLYTAALTALSEHMENIADASGLSTDPELATDYLADAAIHVTPELLATLGQLRGRISGLLAAGKRPEQWTESELRPLQALFDSLSVQDADIENGLEHAMLTSANANGFIQYHITTIEPKLLTFQQTVEEMIYARKGSAAVTDIFSQATGVISNYKELYEKIVLGFADLLQERHRAHVMKRNVVLLASIIAFMGLIALFIFIYRNLAKTELAETALTQKTALLDTVLMNMPLALFAKDARDSYRWIIVNKKAEQVFGLKASDTLGHTDYDLFPKEEADFFHTTDLNVMGGNKIIEIDAEPVTTPYGTITAHTLKVPIYENGEPAILVGMLEDVTAKIEAQNELRIAKEQAEKSNAAKSDFLANMSHELRTPLNSILGMTRLLLESKLAADQHHLADTVYRSSTNLLEIVNDILDLSKIEAGEMQLEKIGIDPNYILRSAAHTLEQLAAEKHLHLIKSFEAQVFPYVMGDPVRLMRILTNLISNAIKYTDHGHIEIRAEYKKLDGHHLEFRCEIIDTGIGVPLEKQKSIFEKFVQADTSTTRKYGGTGLGLAITKQLVELMDGMIGVQSTPGVGSSFWFAIPFEITDKLSEEKSQRRKKMVSGLIQPAAARILVAEDHPMNQLFITQLLSRFGIPSITIVENGFDVLARYKAEHWDMILMDCHMPKKNGYDTTKEIRDLEKNTGKHVPIIAMTANAMIGDKEKCLRYGMDEYISKPIDNDALKEVMGEWIRFGELSAPARAPVTPHIEGALDLSKLKTFSNGDLDLEKELVGIFISQSEVNMKTLRDNCTGNDVHAWQEAGHMLKGGAANMGAMTLSQLCDQAQHMNGPPAERTALFEKISAEYMDVKEQLKGLGLFS